MKTSSHLFSHLLALGLLLASAACAQAPASDSPFDAISFTHYLTDGAVAFHKSIFSSLEF